MKTIPYLKEINAIIGMAMILTILLSSTGFSQDKTVKKESSGRIKIKIIKDENGKSTVIDTTFNLNDKKGKEAYEIFLKEYDTPGPGGNRGMKKVEVHVSDPGKIDSLDLDSLGDSERNIRIFTHDGRHFRVEGLGGDELFDLPEPPEPPFPPQPPCCIDDDMSMPSCMQRSPGNLLDVLGSIPMCRVRNFTIKENKQGSRIIIDVDRRPVLEMPPMQKRMIYINKDGRHEHGVNPEHRRMGKTIIIEKEKENNGEK
jgi:hypothetical protein